MVSRPVTMQGTMEEEHSTLHTRYRSVSAYYYISMHSTLMKKPAAAQFSLSPGKYATQHPPPPPEYICDSVCNPPQGSLRIYCIP